MRAAVVDTISGIVVGIIVADAAVDLPPLGCVLIDVPDLSCKPGWMYDPSIGVYDPDAPLLEVST